MQKIIQIEKINKNVSFVREIKKKKIKSENIKNLHGSKQVPRSQAESILLLMIFANYKF